MNMQASVEGTRRQLDRMRVALVLPFPREIEEALPELEQAVASMRELERALASGTAPAGSMAVDLAALAREVGVVERLTEGGRELTNGWAAILATAAGGYVSSGKPAPLNAASSIRIDG
ncbi:MAG TPA: hypothetical protein VGR73_17515 [Bryobacteraceae bacterium]|nr:hypothetical protein [Bryobacteraceae bacterium]